MKLLKARKDLIFVLNPLFFLVGILIFCFASHIVLSAFYLFWISTLCALWLIISPMGNQRLAHHPDNLALRLPWQKWFFCIALLEFTLCGIYLGITAISSTLFPVNTSAQPMLFATSLQTMLVQYGLFPWSFYALVAVALAILAYRDQTDAYFSHLLSPITKQASNETYSLIVNISMRRCVLFSVGTLLAFMTLLLISLVLPLHIHVAHGFQPAALLTTLILLCLPFSDTLKPHIMRHFSRRIPTYLGFPVFCAILGIIIVLLSLLCTGLSSHQLPPSMPPLMAQWIHYDWPTAWILFSLMWWICMTPLVCIFIARISIGYRVRDVIIGILILPTALAFVFLFQNPLSTAFEFTPTTIKLFSLISFLILLPALLNHKQSSCAIMAYFPKNNIAKPRDHHAFFMNIVRLTIVSLYIYLVVGINGLSLILFASNALCIVILLIASLTMMKALKKV